MTRLKETEEAYQLRLAHAMLAAIAELDRLRAIYPQLAGWKWAWSRTKAAHGDCHYPTKTLRLSIWSVALEPDASLVLNTIRHEIAHALAGKEAKHGDVWRVWAHRCGCNRIASCRAASAEAEAIPARWELVFDKPDGTVEVVRPYHARPSRKFVASLPERWMPGRPETKGRLRLRWWNKP